MDRTGLNLAVAAASVAVLLLAVPALAQAPLKLGSITPMTGGGATVGAAQDIAVRMAIKEINATGGILGRQVVYVQGDTQSDPTVAATEAKRLAFQEKVEAVVGPLSTQEIMPTLPVFTEAKIPQITTTVSDAVTPQVGPYHFSFLYNTSTQVEVVANFARNELKATKVAAIFDNGGQSKASIVVLHDYAKKIGLTIVSEQEFPYRTDDMTPQVLAARRSNPDAVLFFPNSMEDVAKFVGTRRDLGWDVPVAAQLTVPTLGAAAARLTGGDAFKGIYGQYFAGLTYCPGEPEGTGAFAQFKNRLDAFAPEAKGKLPVSLALYTYDAVHVLKAAINGAKSASGPAVQQWMYKNAAGITDVITSRGMAPSPASHFLFGPASFVMTADPHAPRADGLLRRARC